jgi:signal transduction histidine kinase/FixJ family two-component response regulator
MKDTRILVVDDDDHVRDALIDELSASYRVEAVGSGSEAFDALALNQYDVIISDLRMPDHDGIEVLEFARQRQGDAVRVLLTGYLDERARRALMHPDAPFKVGKPWHDEIEVVVKRGLEQRELARRLCASVEDALDLASLDGELEATRTPKELSEVIVRRALTTEGVTACGIVAITGGEEHVFIGWAVPKDGPGWYLDLPIDQDGEMRLHARGVTEPGRHLVSYMAHRAQRRAGTLEARVSLKTYPGANDRMNQLMRQATVGALTSSLLHDLASTTQALIGSLAEISVHAESNSSDLAGAVSEANSAAQEVVQLFVQMRKFIRDGDIQLRPIAVSQLIDRVMRLTGGYVRSRARLHVGELPQITINVSEALFVQVLSNLLRNAANASPAHGVVDLGVRVVGDEIVFTVIDDGPGVSAEIADHMFAPFTTSTPEGAGLGLAISAHVTQTLGGRINYRKDRSRGACFSVMLPLAR